MSVTTWVHREGERNREMVFYDPTSYFGIHCTSRADEAYHDSVYEGSAIWKIRIRPVAWANLETKRVGLIEFYPGWPPGTEREDTHLASFYAVRDDGTEEWQVSRRWKTSGGDTTPRQASTFLVWYQDGAGHTYYDDNDGALYTVDW